MNQQKPTFYYELCRLCLEAEGIYDIFESENLLQDIYACTGVIIFVSDKLPHKICAKCATFIKNAQEFRVLVKQNDAHLQSMFSGDAEVDFIKTIACRTPQVISESQNKCTEVRSAYFENGHKEDSNQSKEQPNTHSNDKSFLQGDPVLIKTESLTKVVSNPPSISSQPRPPSPIKADLKDDPDELLDDMVKIEHICDKMNIDKDEAIDYVCGMCSKTFLTYKKFYLHQRLHKKTIVCPLTPCGKKFATKGDMEKHVRTHTGEKPYVCAFCKKGFTQRVSLKHHVRTIHPKKPAESESVRSKEQSV